MPGVWPVMTHVNLLISHYGLIAILIGAGIEGETVVATGGLFAHRGLLPLPGVMAAAAIGSFTADQIFFHLGRHFRESRVVSRMRQRTTFDRAIRTVEKYPVGFVFAFRFMWGLRTVSPVALGTTRIGAGRFAVLNLLAAIVWAMAIASIGYLFSGTLKALGAHMRTLEHYALAIVALAVLLGTAAWLIRRRWG